MTLKLTPNGHLMQDTEHTLFDALARDPNARQHVRDAAEAIASQRAYPLPDDLYPGSKDWMAADYPGRVAWLHHMYEATKKDRDALVEQAAAPQALTPRELQLIDGMIEVQLHHARQCDGIANRAMAERQKGWDLERVGLLRKLRGASQQGVS